MTNEELGRPVVDPGGGGQRGHFVTNFCTSPPPNLALDPPLWKTTCVCQLVDYGGNL